MSTPNEREVPADLPRGARGAGKRTLRTHAVEVKAPPRITPRELAARYPDTVQRLADVEEGATQSGRVRRSAAAGRREGSGPRGDGPSRGSRSR